MILMELREGITNPIHDGRKKVGCESHKSFDAGTRFTLVGTGSLAVGFFTFSPPCASSDPVLIAALLGASKPVQPETFGEIAATIPWQFNAEQIIDGLMKANIVSERDIKRIAAELAQEQDKAERDEQDRLAPKEPAKTVPPAKPKTQTKPEPAKEPANA